jgi:hypothetical protein
MPKHGVGHDRLSDTQPVQDGYTAESTLLGRDVSRAIQVGVQREATAPIHKQVMGAAVGAGGMPTPTISLGSTRRSLNSRSAGAIAGLPLITFAVANRHAI